jgi:hypothetical protein
MLPRRGQQMDMIRRQHIGMQVDRQPSRVSQQQSEIREAIIVREKTHAPIIASLHDVLWNAWQVDSAAACPLLSWDMTAPKRCASHARAKRQSRTTVARDTLAASAISSVVRPEKNLSSTTRAMPASRA